VGKTEETRCGSECPIAIPKDIAIGRSLPRDYYVARLENGAECWVFRDAAGDWYLHGYFG
jgi:hypothetical protein